MEMPKPTEQHLRMARIAGSWRGTETMQPSEWDPKGGTATGRMTNRVALDGFAVVGDYEQERGGVVTFRGHSVHTWNAGESCHEMHWYDCMGQSPEVFRGNFEGNSLRMTSRNPRGWARMTYDLSHPGRITSRMEMSPDGKAWSTFFDGVYEKVGE